MEGLSCETTFMNISASAKAEDCRVTTHSEIRDSKLSLFRRAMPDLMVVILSLKYATNSSYLDVEKISLESKEAGLIRQLIVENRIFGLF